MEVKARKRLLAILLCAVLSSSAVAGHPLAIGQTCGRWIGYGWGEGYHAREAMPPKRHHAKQVPPPLFWLNTTYGPPSPVLRPMKGAEVLPLPLPPDTRPHFDESQ
jgi:hypothetical protein